MNTTKQTELLNKLRFTPYHEELYHEAVQICKNPDGKSDIDIAWAFFVNINMSFASKLNGGWGKTVFKFNQAASWRCSVIPRLESVITRLDGIYISCQDAIKCIDIWDSPQTCFYLDPPYPETCQGHYDGYTQRDFEKLIDKLKTCQSSFLLSTYENKAIPTDWECFKFPSRAHVSGKGKVRCDKTKTASEKDLGDTHRTELLYRVIRNHNVRPEIQKLFNSGAFDCFV